MIDYFEDTFMSLLPIVKPKDFLLAVTRGPPICKNVIFDLNITSNDLIYEDGLFKVKPMSLNQNGFTKDQIELTKNNTCYEVTPETTISNGKLILRACYNERICSDKLCIRKCCPEDEFFIAGQFGCNKLNNETYVKHGKFHETLLNVSKHRNSFTNGYGILVGVPCGKQGKYILGPNDTYSLTSKGYLDHVQARIYNHHEYCMEMYRNYPDEGFYPFVCFEENEKQCELRCNIYTILQLISCGFFFMTLIVYACLPVLQNLHGKTLMCHVAHIFCAYFSLAIINLVTPERNADKSTATILCKFLGYTMLFSFLSAFSWLNVMCFDIWWTFGGTRGSTSTRRRGHRKRFLLYCLYAWGLACLMTVIVIVVDHTHILPNYLTPGIGLGSCWFNHGKYVYAEIVFFIGPVTLQLIINILFFVVTSINCNKVKAEIDRVIADPSDVRNKRYQADRIRLMMNIKLFIVMGISWILEIISYFMNKYARDWKWREDFFYFSDLYNCLQGLAIFVLFVLKKRVYYALRKRLGFEDRRTSSNATTALHDTSRVNKSASNSTLMSTFQVSSTP
ncbi:PREDICTED: G-protein coupled receptor Mth2 [Polistes dominula]|uniref:G-protein coupled receptor Mth2 n=1 Tax=Polistes dominula TaxID=743375 RepID=A0ABM1JAK9_POLDO|nr:PREDICTED: G-protein coupled receptor Mth2 [Polistes dominula]